MRLKVPKELLLLNAVTVLLVLAITLLPSSALRFILGVPFLLFAPGYALIAALFPRKKQIDTIERIAYSLGFSVATVALIGLLLNYTPWGVRLYPVLISIAFFVLAMSVIAWYRWYRLPETERFQVTWRLPIPWKAEKGIDRTLSITLFAVIVIALGTFLYGILAPGVGEKFTEFYILGAEGKAADYPKELTPGKADSVTVGLINREQTTARYKVVVTLDGEKIGETGEVTLNHDEKWEQVVTFTPHQTGADLKLEFLLFRDGGTQPYQKPLHLWVTVR
ncbi:MAG: DUF1616 domain-containing protein [Chloroflexota bacterium]